MSTPVKLSIHQLQHVHHVLREEVADCTRLGIQLNIDYATLQKLERESMSRRRPVMDCFTEMCELWQKKPKKEKKWSVVYKALKQQDNMRLVRDLKDKGYRKDEEVTLPLKEFINELDEMAAKWDLFGSALGVPMKVLERIQDSNGLERYMKAMLEVWLNTGKATLEQLKKALIEVDNVRLAENIQQKLMEEETDTDSDSDSDSRAAVAIESVSSNKYACQVFYQRRNNVIQATFAIVPKDKLDGLKDHEGEKGPSCTFDIETDKVEIADKAQAGWYPKVTRKEVRKASIDQYTGAGRSPSCVMTVTPASSESTPPKLEMEVELIGSKPTKIMKLEQEAENVSTQAQSTASNSTRTRAQ